MDLPTTAPPGEERPTARYLEIEWWLRDRTRSGTPGDLLPSESELAAQFGVSRMTARQAVQNLAQEGLVERRRGSGTYIAERPFHRHEGVLLSFTEDMRRRGMRAGSQVLEASVRHATAAEIEALRIADDPRVVSIQRIRLADDLPLSIERAALPISCAAVLSANLESGSLHEAMAAIGRTPTIAQSWITARMPSPEERRWLQITGQREPLLIERRIMRDAADVPIEHTESAYLASRYVIDVTFQVHRAARPRRTAKRGGSTGVS
jgi:GntR family transcriptional regulator